MSMAIMTGSARLIALMQAHQKGVWRYLRVLGCDAALADDLTQETFLTALASPFEERGDAATAGWLRTVARNLFLKSLRKPEAKRTAALADDADELFAMPVARDNAEPYLDALRRCLETLDERLRRSIDLRYRERLEGEAIAARLGMSLPGAKKVLARAKDKLRDCVERTVQP